MRDVSNAFCTFSNNCLNDNDCRHCGYGKMLDKAYQQGRADERERIVRELERLKDIAWQDTDSELRIVKANAWDKVDLLNKIIEIVRGGENE